MKKRILSVLTALCLVLTLMPAAGAYDMWEETRPQQNVKFQVEYYSGGDLLDTLYFDNQGNDDYGTVQEPVDARDHIWDPTQVVNSYPALVTCDQIKITLFEDITLMDTTILADTGVPVTITSENGQKTINASLAGTIPSDSNGDHAPGMDAVSIPEGGSLTLDKVTLNITASSGGNATQGIFNGGSLTLSNGSVVSVSGVSQNGVNGGGDITLSGSGTELEVTSAGGSGIKCADLQISDGATATVSSAGAHGVTVSNLTVSGTSSVTVSNAEMYGVTAANDITLDDSGSIHADTGNGVPVRVQNGTLTVAAGASVSGSVYLGANASTAGEGAGSVNKLDPVATVNGFPYTTLSDAYAAANNSGEVVLAKNIELKEQADGIPTGVTLVVPSGVTVTVAGDKAATVLGNSHGKVSVQGGNLDFGSKMVGSTDNYNLKVIDGSVEMDLSNLVGGIGVTIKGSAVVPSGKYWTTSMSTGAGAGSPISLNVTVDTGSILTVKGEFRVANGSSVNVDGEINAAGIMDVRSQGRVTISGKVTVTGTLALHDGSGSDSATASPHANISLSNNGQVLSMCDRGDIPNSQAAQGSFQQTFHGESTPTTFTYQYTLKQTTPVTPPTEDTTPGTSTGGTSSSSSGDLITADRTTGGTVQVRPGRAEAGDTVTITATPNDGYEVGEVVVTDASGKEISVRSEGSNRYTFTMPSGKVNVDVNFVRIGSQQVQQNAFWDVSAAYYYDAVQWAVEQGVTTGTTASTFSPNAGCTRAQIVTFLWRANGSPAPRTTTNPFTDLSPSAYYYDAVLWAVEEGITSGATATTFGPNSTCTRAQAATFLWRAQGSPTAGGSNFSDVADDAYYAGAVDWAVANGVTQGITASSFGPNSTCTRAQIVTFLYRAMA